MVWSLLSASGACVWVTAPPDRTISHSSSIAIFTFKPFTCSPIAQSCSISRPRIRCPKATHATSECFKSHCEGHVRYGSEGSDHLTSHSFTTISPPNVCRIMSHNQSAQPFSRLVTALMMIRVPLMLHQLMCDTQENASCCPLAACTLSLQL